MRIGIDARELCGRATGVGRYLAGLLREWAPQHAPPHEFVLYAPGRSRWRSTRAGSPRAWSAARGGTWWEQVDAAARRAAAITSTSGSRLATPRRCG